MSIVLDTSTVVALMDADDAAHERVAAWIADVDEDLVTTPLAVADMDAFAGAHRARAALQRDLARRAYEVRWWADALAESLAIAAERPELPLTQASLVALARRLDTDRIATTDHDRFGPLATATGTPYVLLPAAES